MQNKTMIESISDRLNKNKEKLFEVMDGVLSKKASTEEVKQACEASDKVLEDVKEDIKKLTKK